MIKRNEVFDKPPRRILWFHGTIDPPPLNVDGIEFYRGLPTEEQITEMNHDFVILDDLMEDCKGRTITRLFTQKAHHSEVTFFLVVQNFFHVPRSISVNAHYIILLNNFRDKLQVRTLSYQMYPNQHRFLVDAFEDATDNRPFSHILLDLCVETPKELRVRANIFDKSITVYIPRP